MKFRLLFLLPLMLAAWTSPAAESIYQFIPEDSDLSVLIRTDNLFRHPALDRIRESGDLKRLKKDLALMPWGLPAGKSAPDVIFVMFTTSRDFAMVLDSGRTVDEMFQQLQKKYEKDASMQVRKGSRNGIPLICVTQLRPGKKDGDRNYFLAYIGQKIVAYTNYRNDMRWDIWERKNYSVKTGASLRILGERDIARGYSEAPKKILVDPTGLMRKLSRFEFQFVSDGTEHGVVLDGLAVSRDTKAESVKRLAVQTKSCIQILLLLFFGADPELFRALNQHFAVTVNGNEVHFRSELSETTLDASRGYYEDHADEVGGSIRQSTGGK